MQPTFYNVNDVIPLETKGGEDTLSPEVSLYYAITAVLLTNSACFLPTASKKPQCSSLGPSYIFCTGRVLRDIIYDSTLEIDHIAREGIIDLEDTVMKGLFRPLEMEEMTERIPENQSLIYLSRNYLHHSYIWREWVCMAIISMARLYDSSSGDLKAQQLNEGWFDSSLWSFLIDGACQSYPWMTLQRKEISSWASKHVAVTVTTPSYQAMPSARYDGILHDRSNHRHLEYGLFEVKKDFITTLSPGWVGDELKSMKGLHGLGCHISASVNHDEDTLRKVQVIAFIHARFNFQVIKATPISPTETLITRSLLNEIPTTIADFPGILLALSTIHRYVQTMNRTKEIVAQYFERKTPPQGTLETIMNYFRSVPLG
ncbi:hypothetical protein RUND412_010514 [Rhizina undulata]